MSSHSSTGADTTTVNLVQTGGFRISNNNNYLPGSAHESPVYVMQSGFYHFVSPGAVHQQPPHGPRPPAARNANAHTLDGHFAGQRIYRSTDSRNSEPGPTRYMSQSSRKADKTGAGNAEGISKDKTSPDPNEKVAPASTGGAAPSAAEESSKTVVTD
ncbi:hypothetical protein H1R20_g7138, partial [Candolleomyces eurysporus]